MYNITFRPNYDEPLELGTAKNLGEAVDVIVQFCNERHYTVEHYEIVGDVKGWVFDPKTQEDYFDIIPVEEWKNERR